MEKNSAIVITCLLLFLRASCQNETTTENVEVQPSTQLFIETETTNSTLPEVMGNSKKDHSQQTITQQSGHISTHDSFDTLTNQTSDSTEPRHTSWTATHVELSTSQASTSQALSDSTEQYTTDSTEEPTVGSTERFLVSSTDISTVGPTNQHTSTTQIFKEGSSEAVGETSIEFSPDTSTKEPSDKSTVGVTYPFTNSTALDSSEHFTELEGGTSTEHTSTQTTSTPTVPSTQEAGDTISVQFVTVSVTRTSSEIYMPATATDISTDLTTTLPVTEQTTEPVTASPHTEQSKASTYDEQSTEPTIASTYSEQSTEPTNASSYTEEFTQPTNASSYTEETTEYTNTSSYTEETPEPANASLYTEETTNAQNITELPIEWSSETTIPQNETVAGYNEESNDDWKIAVGVVIPLSLLIAVLVGVYICYRKKYPVRMIIGREFGKFSNPNYQRRGHVPSLIREDADFFFSSNRTSTSVPSQEFNPVNKKIMYDNMGFVRDENVDEAEQERKFLQNKSWLFKNASEESKTTTEADAESSFMANSPTDEGSRLDANRNETKKSKGAVKSKAGVAEQTTPVVMPRRKKKAPEPPGNKVPFSELKNEPNGQPATLEVTSETTIDVSKNVGSSLPRNFGLPGFDGREPLKDTDSNDQILTNVKPGLQLSQQTALNQEIKERSRSLSLDPIQLDGRQRSSSFDQPSTARKMSLYDEIVEATRLRFLAAQKMTSSITDGVSPVTAFVVGVDIRARAASVTSSVLTADDDSTHEDQANFEDSYPQTPRGTKQYDVNKFHENKDTSALDDTDHYNVPVPHQLLSDSNNEDENHESKRLLGSQIQDNVKNTDVVTSSNLLEDRNHHDHTDSQFTDAFSSSNTENDQVGTSERRTSSASGSSSSSSDNEGIKKDFANATPTSGLEISAIKNSNSGAKEADEIWAARDITKIPRPEDENDQREQENYSTEDGSYDVNPYANISSVGERRQRFKHMSPEMKQSSSSTESVAGSSESSRGIPSDSEEEEEDIDAYFPASIEIPYKNADNASNDEQIVSPHSIIKTPLSRLHQFDDVHDPTSPIADSADISQKAVFQMQYSDSSSDSSDISPRKATNGLSRERQDSDSLVESVHSPEATSFKRGQEQSENVHSPDESATYKFLDFVEDGDVDV